MQTPSEHKTLAREIADELRKHPPVPRVWLSGQDAAAYLDMAHQTLCAFVKADTGPPSFLIGTRSRRFKIADLDAWIEQHGAKL